MKKLILLITLFYTHLAFSAMVASTIHKNKMIAYTDQGRGQPLVLIHAYPTDQRLWQPQEATLKKYFRVITLDLWGFGHSSSLAKNGETVTMDQYAEEVKELLSQLHIQKAIIGGESMGGRIALAFLKNYPDNVAGLILSNTESIADTKETKTKREMTSQQILINGPYQFNQTFLPKALTEKAPRKTRLFLIHILNAQSKEAMASAWRGIAARTDTSIALSKTMHPVLIITSDHDTLISPKQSEKMHVLAKNSQLIVISAAGHLSSLEQPTKWNQAVINMFYKNEIQ